jgi:ligand-binding sensor domain-containing protein
MKQCMSIYNEPVLIESSLSSIIKSPTKELLVSGTHGSIFRFGQNSISKYYTERTDFSCLAVVNNEVWAGTWGSGILVFKKNKLVRTITQHLRKNPVHAIFQDRKKRIWIGKENGISLGENGI